jgi:TatD DNase family protein
VNTLADTHCHLSLDEFSDELDQIVERAREAGVAHLLIPGIDLETSRRAVEIAEGHEGIFAAVGVHPHEASSYSESTRDQLLELTGSPAVVAIGEIGLDFYRDLSPRADQTAAFVDQLALARQLELPVILHNREAQEALLEVLLEWAPTVSRPQKGVLHAFSGDRNGAKKALSSGFFIGVAGPLTYPNAEELRKTIQGLPQDRLVLETDSPYLPPQPHRGQRNEPAYLPLIAEELGRLTERTVDKVIADTSENANRLFGWKYGSAHPILS